MAEPIPRPIPIPLQLPRRWERQELLSERYQGAADFMVQLGTFDISPRLLHVDKYHFEVVAPLSSDVRLHFTLQRDGIFHPSYLKCGPFGLRMIVSQNPYLALGMESPDIDFDGIALSFNRMPKAITEELISAYTILYNPQDRSLHDEGHTGTLATDLEVFYGGRHGFQTWYGERAWKSSYRAGQQFLSYPGGHTFNGDSYKERAVEHFTELLGKKGPFDPGDIKALFSPLWNNGSEAGPLFIRLVNDVRAVPPIDWAKK